MTGQSFVILVGGRREAPIECGAGLRKIQSKRKILHPLFAFLQLAVHTARPNSQARFQFGVGRSPDWPVKCGMRAESLALSGAGWQPARDPEGAPFTAAVACKRGSLADCQSAAAYQAAPQRAPCLAYTYA